MSKSIEGVDKRSPWAEAGGSHLVKGLIRVGVEAELVLSSCTLDTQDRLPILLRPSLRAWECH